MSKEIIDSKFKKMTVNFSTNWNKKLYGKYFTTIRKADYKIFKGDLCEIVLSGKPIMIAKVIESDVLYFHELGQVMVQCDTGLNYGDSLQLFKNFGINVNDFDTKVKCLLFECQQVYTNEKPKE